MGIAQFRSEEERTLAFGSIVANYTIIGTAFAHPLTKIFIYNDTDARLKFSFQGSTENHITLASKMGLMLDIKVDTNDETYLKNGSAVYVKRDETPTVGSVYVTGFYTR